MGIFNKISEMKKQFKDKTEQRKRMQYESDLVELKRLRAERMKLEELDKLNQNVKSNRKKINQLKHPILTKFAKKVKSNLKNKQKVNAQIQPSIWNQSTGDKSMFFGTGTNPFAPQKKKKK